MSKLKGGKRKKKKKGTFVDGMRISLALKALDRDSINPGPQLVLLQEFFSSGYVFLMVTRHKKRAAFPVQLWSRLKSGALTPG